MAVRTLNLVLPEETVRTIEAKVASGRYPDAEAMIQTALEGLETEEEFSDDWIRQEVLPALNALEANPSSGLTLEEAFANLDEDEEEGQESSSPYRLAHGSTHLHAREQT